MSRSRINSYACSYLYLFIIRKENANGKNKEFFFTVYTTEAHVSHSIIITLLFS
jgi:hypothetical protein